MSDITVDAALVLGRNKLKKAGIDTYQLDARYLLRDVLGFSDSDLISHSKSVLKEDQLNQYMKYIGARTLHKPVSKILGKKEFWGLEFKVSEDVLDPRPDTEVLIEHVLEFVKKSGFEAPKILDLGTGSGCIPISLATELPKAQICSVDISPKALEIAQFNAQKHDVATRITFLEGQWAHGITDKFDIVTSNPPYITSKTCESLMPEVRNHDPILALDGGEDGNDAYREIFSHIFPLINPQGAMFLELDSSNLAEIRRLCEMHRVALDSVFQDYGQRNRVVKIVHGEK